MYCLYTHWLHTVNKCITSLWLKNSIRSFRNVDSTLRICVSDTFASVSSLAVATVVSDTTTEILLFATYFDVLNFSLNGIEYFNNAMFNRMEQHTIHLNVECPVDWLPHISSVYFVYFSAITRLFHIWFLAWLSFEKPTFSKRPRRTVLQLLIWSFVQ